ncbi:MAG: HAMP domain-containing sensor histidine kinase [Candidatus Thermoplasmatota archaeon]
MESVSPPVVVTRREAFGLAGLVALIVALEVLEDRFPIFDNLGVLLLVVLFGQWALWAQRAAKQWVGWERNAWRWFSAAAWFLVLQVLIFGIARQVNPAFAATLATREAAPVLAYPLLVVGLIMLARRRSRTSVVLRTLDAILLGGAVFFILWSAVFRDLYGGSPQPIDERFELMSYPVFGAVAAASAWLILGLEGRRLPTYRLVVVAVSLPLFTDTYSSLLGLQGNDLGGRIGDLGLVLAAAVWLVAARAAARSPAWPSGDAPSASRLENYMPLVTIALATGTAAQTLREHGQLSSLQTWLAAGLILVLVVRMGVTLSQNVALERSLRNLLDERTRLLRFVSHELANPLSPLTVGMALLHREGQDEAARQRNLASMDRSVGRLKRLSNDVRALALAETGRLEIRKEPADLADVVVRAVQAAQGDAGAKGVSVVAESAPAIVCPMDAERVGQVIDNLLSNAIKFTPQGGHVVVRVRLVDRLGRVEVQDDGLGLTEQQSTELFQAFRRFHPGVAAGLGLGLHLSRTLVEAHDGRMGATSAGAGQGSTFWFDLPLDAPITAVTGQPVPASATESNPTPR